MIPTACDCSHMCVLVCVFVLCVDLLPDYSVLVVEEEVTRMLHIIYHVIMVCRIVSC